MAGNFFDSCYNPSTAQINMSLRETLERLFGGGRRQSKPEGKFTVEGTGKKEIGFYDLREPDKAKERGVEPGFYMSAFPITKLELKDEFLLHKLTFQFFEKLGELGLMQSGDTRIAVDTQGEAFVDPSQGWLFAPSGYIEQMQMLIVQTNPVERDANQALLVQVLGKKS